MDLYSSLPVALCASKPIFTPLSRYSTTLTKSASLKLRDVKAGTPVKQRTMSYQHSTSPHSITTIERQGGYENKENYQLDDDILM